MINIAVIGGGYWGKNIIRNFYELGNLRTICDSNKSLENMYKDKYASVNFVTDYFDVFTDKNIDGVIISTPAETHYNLVRDAILSKKHVFVEKPLSLNVKQGESLLKLSKENNRILMVGHILQYHPAVIKLKEIIDSGDLGNLRYVYSNRLSIGKIRTEENILWSFAPHDISTMIMLLGEFPISVQSTGGEYLQKKIADVTMTTFEFKNNVRGHIFISWLHPFKEQKLIVVGDKKMAVFDDVSNEKLFIYPHTIEWKERIPVANKASKEVINIKMKEPLKEECKHFISCIEENKLPRTDGEEGLRVLRVLQACQESLDSNGKKIYFDNKPFSTMDIHPTSEIDDNCLIGKGTKIWHFSHIMKNSLIGEDCKIGQNVVIGPNVKIGNGCKIQNNVSVYEGVTLEDHVFCGPSMVFTNVFNPRSSISRIHEIRKTTVKNGATIGANATIVCGNNIGSYSFVGAGSVVTKDVPDYALVLGNPAKVVGWMCSCGNKIKFTGNVGSCIVCGKKFIKQENDVREEE